MNGFLSRATHNHTDPADWGVNNRGINGGRGTRPPDYVSQRPGQPTLPDSSGHERTERVRLGMFNTIMEAWLPFTYAIASRFIPPRAPNEPFESPLDLDAAERITRMGPFPSMERPFPYPWMCGAVNGFMPMLDAYSMAWAWGKTPSGPSIGTPIPIPFDITYPELPKVTG